jgi:hypothetical protein
MLSAENSTIMAQKDQYRRTFFPQRTKARCIAVRVGEGDIGELAAQGFGHAGHFLGWRKDCQAEDVCRRFAQMIADQEKTFTAEARRRGEKQERLPKSPVIAKSDN